MSSFVEALVSQPTYPAIRSLETQVNQWDRGKVTALRDGLYLFQAPSRSMRLQACLSGLPLVGCLVPSWQRAKATCNEYDQRLCHVNALLVGQRQFLMAEYGGADALRQVMRGEGTMDAAVRLTGRTVDDFRQIAGAEMATDELLQVLRAVARYREGAAIFFELAGNVAEYDKPFDDPATLRLYTHGLMNLALETHVVAHRNETADVVGPQERRELRPEVRRELLAGFRARLAHAQWTAADGALLRLHQPRALTPREVDRLCEAYLADKGMLARGTRLRTDPEPVIWHAPRVQPLDVAGRDHKHNG
ncbi:hypothetical protein ACT80S_14155 [Ramlibacter sp. MAHUQ-53]|uniref:hypothetical protein n=1 Tax=unclassified Ramlibacter TaxID=2617605 RepID=UPI00362F6364